jgi:MFS family permease
MIVFRAFSGIAASFCLPSAVSLINEVFPPGWSRNVAFASMGGAQPVGFGIGLTLGGVFTGTIGWQWGFYAAAITNFVMLVVAAWQLPKNVQNASHGVWQRLASDIDWVGAIIASISLAMLSYVIAYVKPRLAIMEFHH